MKWISQLTSDQLFWVRVLAGAQVMSKVKNEKQLYFSQRYINLVDKESEDSLIHIDDKKSRIRNRLYLYQ